MARDFRLHLRRALLGTAVVAAAGGASASAATGGRAAPVSVRGTGGASPHRAAVARGRAPVITWARCVGAGHCDSDPHAVLVGGRLEVRGQRLAPGMLVIFPRTASAARRHKLIEARVRRSRRRLVFSVPSGARSGRIVVVGAGGLHSPPYGPIHVLTRLPRGASGDVQPTGTAFDGIGMWIWYLSRSDGGNLDKLAADAHAAGISTLYVKSSDGSANYWSQFSSALVSGLHQRGLHVCAWQYVYGTQPSGEAALGAQAVQAGADCLVIDAESEYEGRYAAAQTYIQALRAAVGARYPIGLASFPYVDYHKTQPYSVFLGPGGAQFNVPQAYWHTIGTSVDGVYTHTYHENRLYARPILPLGQTYGGAPASEIYRFRQLGVAYGASGISFWDWQDTTARGFAAIAQPLTPAANAVVDNSYPLFSQGAKGDQVVWMQEHLAAAEPQTPTSGIFDATTTAALRAFQAARGLPQTGSTDAATWHQLLSLTPVKVDWTGGGPSG